MASLVLITNPPHPPVMAAALTATTAPPHTHIKQKGRRRPSRGFTTE